MPKDVLLDVLCESETMRKRTRGGQRVRTLEMTTAWDFEHHALVSMGNSISLWDSVPRAAATT